MCNVKTNYVCIQNYWMNWNFLLLTLKQNATIVFALFTFYFLIFSTLQERYVSLFQKGKKKKKRHMKKNPYKSWDLTEYTEFATWFLLLLSKSINFYSLQEYPVSKIWVSPSILNFTTKVSIFSANILTILITATIFHRCYCVIISAETEWYLSWTLPSYILTEPSRAVQKLQEVLVQSATQFSHVHPYLSYHLGSPYTFSQLMKNLKSGDTFATVTTLRSALWLCFSSKWSLSSECSQAPECDFPYW